MTGEDDQDADVEQVGAPGELPAPQQLARSAAPGVLLAVEAHEAAEQEHGEAEVRVPAEDDVGDQCRAWVFPHERGLVRGMSGAGRKAPRTRAMRPSLQPSPAAGPEVDRLVFPGGIERREIGRVRIGQMTAERGDFLVLRLCRRRARPARGTPPHRQIGACAGARPSAAKICAGWPSVSQASLSGRVDRYSRNSGRKSGSSAALIVRPACSYCAFEIDHGLAAVAAFAMHVLEQMQRQRARAVEQQHVALLQVVEIAGGELGRSVWKADATRPRGSVCLAPATAPISGAASLELRASDRSAAPTAP